MSSGWIEVERFEKCLREQCLGEQMLHLGIDYTPLVYSSMKNNKYLHDLLKKQVVHVKSRLNSRKYLSLCNIKF